jgi:Ca2+-binding EF-hand superfamily protein
MTSLRNTQAITELFNHYDSERKGIITKERLRYCIHDLTGRTIDDRELNCAFSLFESKEEEIYLKSFIPVIEMFFRFC